MDFREMMAQERELALGEVRYQQGYADGVAYAAEQFNAWIAKGSGDGIGAEAEAYIATAPRKREVGKPLTADMVKPKQDIPDRPRTLAFECETACRETPANPCVFTCIIAHRRQAERDAVNAGAAEFAAMVNDEEAEFEAAVTAYEKRGYIAAGNR